MAEVTLVVGNTWTHITAADSFIVKMLDQELQYPSPAAQAMATGWKAPEDYGGWDGWVRILRKPRTQPWYFPTGLLSEVIRLCKKFGYTGWVRDTRERPPEGMPDIGAGVIPLRDYQVEGAAAAVKAGRGILDMPPRSGKTRTMIEIYRQISLSTVWIAPTDRIVDQTRQAVEEFFGPGYVAHLRGAKRAMEAAEKAVVVCTAATAGNLPQEFYDTRQVLIVDEWHHCLSPTTRVLTATGWKPIVEIRVGEKVWAEGSRGLGWYSVRNTWERPAPREMYRFRFSTGAMVEITGGHRVYTPRGGRQYADELRAGGAVHVLQVRKGVFSERPLYPTHEGVYWAQRRISGLRQLRAADPQKELWRAPHRVFRSQLDGQSRGPRPGHAGSICEQGVSQALVRADAGRAQSGKAIGRKGKTGQGLARRRARALWAREKWERRGQDRIGENSARGAGAFGVSGRVSGGDGGQARGTARGLVQFGSGAPGEKDSGRDRRKQPYKSSRCGRSERSMVGGPWLAGISYSCGGSARGAGLATAAIESIEAISAPCTSVYDLEVEDAHNYFAEGVKVSNSAAKTYRQVFKLCDHIYYRYGMTGTHYRSGADALEMHGLISEVIHRVDTRDLLRRGHLVPTHVAFIPVPAHPKLRGVPKQFQGGHGTYGIHEHDVRNGMVASAAFSLAEDGRKVLILVGTKKQGRIVRDILRAWLPRAATAEFQPVEFVSTDIDRGTQRRILDSYLTSDEVRILLGTTLLGEGVDLPAVDALVYARGEQAEVSLKQAAYRVCTAVEGKRSAVIVDFADRHHRKLREHSHARLDVYLKEPIFSVSVLGDGKDFGPWLRAAGGEGCQ